MNEAVSPGALSTLFTDARTHNGWRETPVSDETLREIYALMKWGPTSDLLVPTACSSELHAALPDSQKMVTALWRTRLQRDRSRNV